RAQTPHQRAAAHPRAWSRPCPPDVPRYRTGHPLVPAPQERKAPHGAMRPRRQAGAFASLPNDIAMQQIDEPALTAELIRARYDALLARLRAAAESAGRDADAIRLVAVTKGFGAGVVLQ